MIHVSLYELDLVQCKITIAQTLLQSMGFMQMFVASWGLW